MRWPPVPPPVRTILIAARNAERGMRNAEHQGKVRSSRLALRLDAGPVCSAFRVPHSAFSCSHAPPPSSNADQDARRDEGDEQAGPPVRDERQRDARGREERERYADVQHRGDPDHPRESHREQPAERIAGRLRHAEAEPGERAEQHDEREHAEKAPLLADRRENEVGIGVGQVAELLLPLAQSDAEQAPRAHPDERLVHLPRRLGGRAPGVQERDDAGETVLRARHRAEQDGCCYDGNREEVADARAGGKQRSEEHTSELQSRLHLVCRLLLEKKKIPKFRIHPHHTTILLDDLADIAEYYCNPSALHLVNYYSYVTYYSIRRTLHPLTSCLF